MPDGHAPRLPYVPLMRELRRAVNGVPVMALGRITDPAEAEGLIARGDAELIGLGRPLIADAAWLNKAVAGRAHDIRYCVSCNTPLHHLYHSLLCYSLLASLSHNTLKAV